MKKYILLPIAVCVSFLSFSQYHYPATAIVPDVRILVWQCGHPEFQINDMETTMSDQLWFEHFIEHQIKAKINGYISSHLKFPTF